MEEQNQNYFAKDIMGVCVCVCVCVCKLTSSKNDVNQRYLLVIGTDV